MLNTQIRRIIEMKKHGFDRLRGVAAAATGAFGLCLLGGGSARAATTPTGVSVKITGADFNATWKGISNNAGSQVLQGQTVTTAGGFAVQGNTPAFGISSASITTAATSYTSFYDSGMNLAVDNTLFVNPGGTVDLTDTTVTTNTVQSIAGIAGLNAGIQYYFVPDRAVVRGLYTLTNTTDNPIFTSMLVLGDYGSDNATTVQWTSGPVDDDQNVEDSDLWVVTNDSGVVGDEGTLTPTATIATQGIGASVTPKTVITVGSAAPGGSGATDKFGYRYDVTVPANEQISIMLFNEMTTTITDARAGAADLESLAAMPANLKAGLDTAPPILNYQGRNGVITATARIRPGDDLEVTLIDQDLNTKDQVETVVVTVSNDNTPQTEDLTLTETGNLTGEFEGTLQTAEEPAPDPGGGTMVVQIGDTLTTSYTDNPDANAGSKERIALTDVVENLAVGVDGNGGGGGCSMTTGETNRVDPAFPALLIGALGSLMVLRSRKRRGRR
jgi:hypothetical protein